MRKYKNISIFRISFGPNKNQLRYGCAKNIYSINQKLSNILCDYNNISSYSFFSVPLNFI